MPAEFTRHNPVTRSPLATATVLTASKPLLLFPSGRKAFPYWKNRMGQASFLQLNVGCQYSPSRLPKTQTARSRLTWLGSTIVEKNNASLTRQPLIEEPLSAATVVRVPRRS